MRKSDASETVLDGTNRPIPPFAASMALPKTDVKISKIEGVHGKTMALQFTGRQHGFPRGGSADSGLIIDNSREPDEPPV